MTRSASLRTGVKEVLARFVLAVCRMVKIAPRTDRPKRVITSFTLVRNDAGSPL